MGLLIEDIPSGVWTAGCVATQRHIVEGGSRAVIEATSIVARNVAAQRVVCQDQIDPKVIHACTAACLVVVYDASKHGHITTVQDATAALKIAEDIESYEMEDWQITHIKAQTAQNLGQYQKAEQAWRHLVENSPQKPEFAYGLANILILIDKNNYRLVF